MNEFEKTIKAHIEKVAQSDAAFAAKYEAKGKDIKGCCSYIIAEVRRSGRQGFADAEIYGMAVHYFDEGLEAPKGAVKCDVVVNHTIDLTDEEKAKMREDAIRAYKEKVIREEQEKEAKAKKAAEEKERKRKEAEKARKEEEERKRKEWETADMLFVFDEEDE